MLRSARVRSPRVLAVLVALAAVIVVAPAGPAGANPRVMASAATDGSASAPHPAVYPGALNVSSAPVTSGGIVPKACTPYVDGDDPHPSSGDVSVHGWWYRGSCANQKTEVTIYLYEYFSDGTWHYQAKGKKTVWPGGGSANRAVARQQCEGVARASWRSLVVVKLGNGASAYMPGETLNCTHW